MPSIRTTTGTAIIGGMIVSAIIISNRDSGYVHRSGDYIVGDKNVLIEGDLEIKGGRFIMGKNNTKVQGNVLLRKEAEFVPSKSFLEVSGDIFVEKREKTVPVPAIYSGSVLISSTGSKVETYTPSLGNIIIVP